MPRSSLDCSERTVYRDFQTLAARALARSVRPLPEVPPEPRIPDYLGGWTSRVSKNDGPTGAVAPGHTHPDLIAVQRDDRPTRVDRKARSFPRKRRAVG